MQAHKKFQWTVTEVDGCYAVCPEGDLTPMNYRDFTDTLVKYAVDEPDALIVVLDELRVQDRPLYGAFTSAWMRVREWPGVPIVLVVAEPTRRARLRASAIRRSIPVYESVGEAVRELAAGPARRRAVLDLAPIDSCARYARRFVEATCVRWNILEVRVYALLIITELMENTHVHSRADGDVQVRLELRNGLFSMAVGDGDPREAVLREPGADGSIHDGLHVVSRLARTWGCAPQWPMGKVVWAVLAIDRCEAPVVGRG
ncbi:ATP-binding protein [Nocardia jejuensis]|uniref:ATP-binding protein n=1 Tax=Nocardia jejuensis TaxID=328049 RepID=UPI000A03E706|nr:ATP-binding protein [Nocardia jejuensis]